MIKEIEFTKMHALGNDYIVINETETEVIPEEAKNKLSNDICTRRFSVGSDGVYLHVNQTNLMLDSVYLTVMVVKLKCVEMVFVV